MLRQLRGSGGRANTPHGGVIKDLFVRDTPRHAKLLAESDTLPALTLTERYLYDLKLILNSGFSPLEGGIVIENRLADSAFFRIKPGAYITLYDLYNNRALVILTVEDIYRPDKYEIYEVFSSPDNKTYPGIKYLFYIAKEFYISSKTYNPIYYTYHELTPGDINYFTRVRYTTIRKNHGVIHFINKHGIKILANMIPKGTRIANISGTKLRYRLRTVKVLHEQNPLPSTKGFTSGGRSVLILLSEIVRREDLSELIRAGATLIEKSGPFFLIYVVIPLEYPKKTDRRSINKKARAGKIKGFTGVDNPYKNLVKPDLIILLLKS
ncbi:PUA-like protein [Sodiomyces alkalinus F11]|uniref:PUA-like protein n=1 Tax=Sodiomyces alkalinus (strain CBS 110278 / VKM F-3762 / F11) TaxID=1314773 RepID=A0A3N2Q3P3_SODAK|nr:PUA-like protein [Sodiomyces alkalinus F11]ROT41288.1 PUA-like protein [Sodiomyces alkalinus F11]